MNEALQKLGSVLDWLPFLSADRFIRSALVPADRPAPRLSDLHPELAQRLIQTAIQHERSHPNLSLAIIWTVRTVEQQQKAFRLGRTHISGADGRWGLHNYGRSGVPCCPAVDVWIYMTRAPESLLYEYRPGDDHSKLILLGPTKRVWKRYKALGDLAVMAGLESGTHWPRLKDGPHIQLTRKDRIKALQMILNRVGEYALAVDGIDGAKTMDAVRSEGSRLSMPWRVSWRQRRTMPLPPDLWVKLHELGRGL